MMTESCHFDSEVIMALVIALLLQVGMHVLHESVVHQAIAGSEAP